MPDATYYGRRYYAGRSSVSRACPSPSKSSMSLFSSFTRLLTVEHFPSCVVSHNFVFSLLFSFSLSPPILFFSLPPLTLSFSLASLSRPSSSAQHEHPTAFRANFDPPMAMTRRLPRQPRAGKLIFLRTHALSQFSLPSSTSPRLTHYLGLLLWICGRPVSGTYPR